MADVLKRTLALARHGVDLGVDPARVIIDSAICPPAPVLAGN